MRKSFTLVELGVVLTVIAGAAAITLVSINYVAPKKIETTARRIITELTWLRQYTETQIPSGDNWDYTAAVFRYNAADGDYIDFYKARDPLMGVGNWDPIKTVYLRNDPSTRITSPSPVFVLFFERLQDVRKAVPARPAVWAEPPPWQIEIDYELKIEVERDTGHIRYVK